MGETGSTVAHIPLSTINVLYFGCQCITLILYIYIYIYFFFFILKAALDDDNGVHPMSAYATVRKLC